MPATVTFIDTSVLCELLDVPGMCSKRDEIRDELERRDEDGQRFVIPITAVIETGNHIAQCTGDRRAAAQRFVDLLTAARSSTAPFTVHNVDWDDAFLDDLCRGGGTGEPFIDLAARKMGAGDVAILVERDRFRRDSAYTQVKLWTLDGDLAVYA